MMQSMILLALTIGLAPVAAHAQVIEISDAGEARTFDQPTVFAGTNAVSIRVHVAKSPIDPPRTLFAEAAKSHGLDQSLLEAVAWQESRGRMSAVSPKGALGIMQLLPTTAAELGVRADDLSDNIRGGALYLRRQLDLFDGSVPLALAAYNAGPGAVLRYGGIPPYRETRDYVARVMQRWRPPRATAAPATSSSTEVLHP